MKIWKGISKASIANFGAVLLELAARNEQFLSFRFLIKGEIWPFHSSKTKDWSFRSRCTNLSEVDNVYLRNALYGT